MARSLSERMATGLEGNAIGAIYVAQGARVLGLHKESNDHRGMETPTLAAFIGHGQYLGVLDSTMMDRTG